MSKSNLKNTRTFAEAWDIRTIEAETQNIYQSLSIISKRANQISAYEKEELNRKLEEFAYDHDNLEEVFENREQIEISSHYERLPKSTLVATQEFVEGKVYWRLPEQENNETQE
jgi:DNA-directed RNA polymerase subunit K/omega